MVAAIGLNGELCVDGSARDVEETPDTLNPGHGVFFPHPHERSWLLGVDVAGIAVYNEIHVRENGLSSRRNYRSGGFIFGPSWSLRST